MGYNRQPLLWVNIMVRNAIGGACTSESAITAYQKDGLLIPAETNCSVARDSAVNIRRTTPIVGITYAKIWVIKLCHAFIEHIINAR